MRAHTTPVKKTAVQNTRFFAKATVFALVLSLCFASCLCVPAFAEDDDNVVNDQQLPDSSFIYDTSIASLGGADAYFDGQTVQVVGEAIGEALSADVDGSHKWVTLMASDGSDETLSVYMTTDAASRIDLFGRYGVMGTTLQVRGTFYLACAEHDGLSDLHAENVSIVKKGIVKSNELDLQEFVPGAVCIAVGLLITFVYLRLRERQR